MMRLRRPAPSARGYCGRSGRRSQSSSLSTTTRPGCFECSGNVRRQPKPTTVLRRGHVTKPRDGAYRKAAGSASPTPWTRAGRKGSEHR